MKSTEYKAVDDQKVEDSEEGAMKTAEGASEDLDGFLFSRLR